MREILKHGDTRRLRNATVKQCAEALGLEVSELRDLPLERLLPRMNGLHHQADEEALKLLREKASHPELASWIENATRNELLNSPAMTSTSCSAFKGQTARWHALASINTSNLSNANAG